MTEFEALDAFAALAHPARHRLFAEVAATRPVAVPLTRLAQASGLSEATVRIHAAQLVKARLLATDRSQGVLAYRVDSGGVRALIGLLSAACEPMSPTPPEAHPPVLGKAS